MSDYKIIKEGVAQPAIPPPPPRASDRMPTPPYKHTVTVIDGPIRITPLDAEGNPSGPSVTFTDRVRVEEWSTEPHTPAPTTWYLLRCLVCEPSLDMPFTSAEERGRWSAAHSAGTGHNQWRVWNEYAPHIEPERFDVV